MSDQSDQPEPAPIDPVPLTPPVVDAVVRDGLIVPVAPLDLPEGTPLRVYLALRLGADPPPESTARSTSQIVPHVTRLGASPRPAWAGLVQALALPLGRSGLLAELTRLDALLLTMGMLIYAIVRLVALAAFPIYFFCDEAIQTNLAEELLRNGMRSADGMLLPPYFRNVEKWSLSLTVYIQALSLALFGKSVEVTRATSAIVSLLAGIAVALTLRLVFRLRIWWVGPLVLSALPVWFLHSRTAFETVMMVAFYACFLCCYLLYRVRDPRWIAPAIVFGGATFYSYTNGQGVMLISGVLLLFSDLGYHLRMLRERWRLMLVALLTLALTAAQYVRFRLVFPDAMAEHLSVMASVWLRDVPLSEKLTTFGSEYLEGLSPFYWYSPINGADLDRHLIKGAGNLPLILLPFGLIGVVECLRNWRSPAHRAILAAVLAAPFAAALVFIHNYRALAMVIPAAILISLGLERAFTWLARRLPARPVALVTGVLLAGMSLNLLRVSLSEGPTWYHDYGLYGMQYGATQVFPAVSEELTRDPELHAYVSHAWANNPNAFVPFFLPEEQRGRMELALVDDFLVQKREIPPDALFVMTAAEYETAIASGKLELDPPARLLPYPDGQPGFYFVRMRYVDNIDAILAAEREARRRLVEGSVLIDGQPVHARFSPTDLGALADLFDGDPATVLRGVEANPFVLEFTFAEPRSLSALQIDGWQTNIELTLTVTPPEGAPVTFTQSYANLPRDPRIEYMVPGGPLQASTLRIEIRDMAAADVAKIHIRNLLLKP